MLKIKKGFSIKFILIIINIVFLCNTCLYALPVSKYMLRVPLGINKQKLDMALAAASRDSVIKNAAQSEEPFILLGAQPQTPVTAYVTDWDGTVMYTGASVDKTFEEVWASMVKEFIPELLQDAIFMQEGIRIVYATAGDTVFPRISKLMDLIRSRDISIPEDLSLANKWTEIFKSSYEKHCEEFMLDGQDHFVPGVLELFNILKQKGIPVVVATAVWRSLLDKVVVWAGLDGEGSSLSGAYSAGKGALEDFQMSKKADVILKAQEIAGIEGPRVMVGDSPRDIEAAKEAGVFCIGVSKNPKRRLELAEAGADVLISDYALALPQLLQWLGITAKINTGNERQDLGASKVDLGAKMATSEFRLCHGDYVCDYHRARSKAIIPDGVPFSKYEQYADAKEKAIAEDKEVIGGWGVWEPHAVALRNALTSLTKRVKNNASLRILNIGFASGAAFEGFFNVVNSLDLPNELTIDTCDPCVTPLLQIKEKMIARGITGYEIGKNLFNEPIQVLAQGAGRRKYHIVLSHYTFSFIHGREEKIKALKAIYDSLMDNGEALVVFTIEDKSGDKTWFTQEDFIEMAQEVGFKATVEPTTDCFDGPMLGIGKNFIGHLVKQTPDDILREIESSDDENEIIALMGELRKATYGSIEDTDLYLNKAQRHLSELRIEKRKAKALAVILAEVPALTAKIIAIDFGGTLVPTNTNIIAMDDFLLKCLGAMDLLLFTDDELNIHIVSGGRNTKEKIEQIIELFPSSFHMLRDSGRFKVSEGIIDKGQRLKEILQETGLSETSIIAIGDDEETDRPMALKEGHFVRVYPHTRSVSPNALDVLGHILEVKSTLIRKGLYPMLETNRSL